MLPNQNPSALVFARPSVFLVIWLLCSVSLTWGWDNEVERHLKDTGTQEFSSQHQPRNIFYHAETTTISPAAAQLKQPQPEEVADSSSTNSHESSPSWLCSAKQDDWVFFLLQNPPRFEIYDTFFQKWLAPIVFPSNANVTTTSTATHMATTAVISRKEVQLFVGYQNGALEEFFLRLVDENAHDNGASRAFRWDNHLNLWGAETDNEDNDDNPILGLQAHGPRVLLVLQKHRLTSLVVALAGMANEAYGRNNNNNIDNNNDNDYSRVADEWTIYAPRQARGHDLLISRDDTTVSFALEGGFAEEDWEWCVDHWVTLKYSPVDGSFLYQHYWCYSYEETKTATKLWAVPYLLPNNYSEYNTSTPTTTPQLRISNEGDIVADFRPTPVITIGSLVHASFPAHLQGDVIQDISWYLPSANEIDDNRQQQHQQQEPCMVVLEKVQTDSQTSFNVTVYSKELQPLGTMAVPFLFQTSNTSFQPIVYVRTVRSKKDDDPQQQEAKQSSAILFEPHIFVFAPASPSETNQATADVEVQSMSLERVKTLGYLYNNSDDASQPTTEGGSDDHRDNNSTSPKDIFRGYDNIYRPMFVDKAGTALYIFHQPSQSVFRWNSTTQEFDDRPSIVLTYFATLMAYSSQQEMIYTASSEPGGVVTRIHHFPQQQQQQQQQQATSQEILAVLKEPVEALIVLEEEESGGADAASSPGYLFVISRSINATLSIINAKDGTLMDQQVYPRNTFPRYSVWSSKNKMLLACQHHEIFWQEVFMDGGGGTGLSSPSFGDGGSYNLTGDNADCANHDWFSASPLWLSHDDNTLLTPMSSFYQVGVDRGQLNVTLKPSRGLNDVISGGEPWLYTARTVGYVVQFQKWLLENPQGATVANHSRYHNTKTLQVPGSAVRLFSLNKAQLLAVVVNDQTRPTFFYLLGQDLDIVAPMKRGTPYLSPPSTLAVSSLFEEPDQFRVLLNWTNVPGNSGYVIQRAQESEPVFKDVFITSTGSTSYLEGPMSHGSAGPVLYFYRVAAINGNLKSAYSEEISVRIEEDNKDTLSWKDSFFDGETIFFLFSSRIERFSYIQDEWMPTVPLENSPLSPRRYLVANNNYVFAAIGKQLLRYRKRGGGQASIFMGDNPTEIKTLTVDGDILFVVHSGGFISSFDIGTGVFIDSVYLGNWRGGALASPSHQSIFYSSADNDGIRQLKYDSIGVFDKENKGNRFGDFNENVNVIWLSPDESLEIWLSPDESKILVSDGRVFDTELLLLAGTVDTGTILDAAWTTDRRLVVLQEYSIDGTSTGIIRQYSASLSLLRMLELGAKPESILVNESHTLTFFHCPGSDITETNILTRAYPLNGTTASLDHALNCSAMMETPDHAKPDAVFVRTIPHSVFIPSQVFAGRDGIVYLVGEDRVARWDPGSQNYMDSIPLAEGMKLFSYSNIHHELVAWREGIFITLDLSTLQLRENNISLPSEYPYVFYLGTVGDYIYIAARTYYGGNQVHSTHNRLDGSIVDSKWFSIRHWNENMNLVYSSGKRRIYSCRYWIQFDETNGQFVDFEEYEVDCGFRNTSRPQLWMMADNAYDDTVFYTSGGSVYHLNATSRQPEKIDRVPPGNLVTALSMESGDLLIGSTYSTGTVEVEKWAFPDFPFPPVKLIVPGKSLLGLLLMPGYERKQQYLDGTSIGERVVAVVAPNAFCEPSFYVLNTSLGILPPATEILSVPSITNCIEYTVSEVLVIWTDVSGEADYQLERLEGNLRQDGWRHFATTKAGATYYIDHTVRIGRLYHYRVKAINGGVASDLSDAATIVFTGRGMGNTTRNGDQELPSCFGLLPPYFSEDNPENDQNSSLAPYFIAAGIGLGGIILVVAATCAFWECLLQGPKAFCPRFLSTGTGG